MSDKEKEQLRLLVAMVKDLALATVGNNLMSHSSERKLLEKLEKLDRLESEW